MHVRVVENYTCLGEKAAEIVAAALRANPRLTLGLPTGGTPEGMYEALARRFQAGECDFSQLTAFNLDEYVGLESAHPQSYSFYMEKHFYSRVNVDRQKVFLPSWSGGDCVAFCRSYDALIASKGGIDLQILGIGINGHIGFNEPGPILHRDTHLIDLAPETLKANSRFFPPGAEVPRQAITMGMGTIMGAKEILLLASGSAKSRALAEALDGFIRTTLPASILQLHPSCTVLADKEAGVLLKGGFVP